MAAEHAGPGGLVVVACCKYEGWGVPLIRDRVTEHSGLRARVLVLSARYGLVTADAPVSAYEQPLTANPTDRHADTSAWSASAAVPRRGEHSPFE